MPGYGLKSEKITAATANTAVSLGTGELPGSTLIQYAGAGSVYIGGSDVSSTNGYQITASLPIVLADIMGGGHSQSYNRAAIYIVGTQNNDAVKILYPKRDESAV